MKSKTMNLLESIQNNIKEDENNLNWFKNEGLSIAREIVNRNGNLNCCDEIADTVVAKAKENGINCNVINCGVFTENNSGTSHNVIQYYNVLIDYTQKQFFGSNNPEDCVPDLIGQYSDGVYTNDYFTTFDGNTITGWTPNMISDIQNHNIIPDTNNWIIYIV